MAWVLREFQDNSILVTQLSATIVEFLTENIRKRGRASLAVSGGTTPRTLFEALSQQDLPWQDVTITLVDERWVEEDDPASNAGLVRRHLLQGHAARARFVGLKTAVDDPSVAVAEVDRRLRAEVLDASGSIDVAILGMGTDGHIASFFPGPGLVQAWSEQSRCCCAVPARPSESAARMTMTLKTLLQADHLLLHCIGPEKRRVLDTAMKSTTVKSATLEREAIEELPVRAVLHQDQRLLEIYHAEQ